MIWDSQGYYTSLPKISVYQESQPITRAQQKVKDCCSVKKMKRILSDVNLILSVWKI